MRERQILTNTTANRQMHRENKLITAEKNKHNLQNDDAKERKYGQREKIWANNRTR